MTGEHYTDTSDILINRKIIASRIKAIVQALDDKIYGALNGVESHNYFKAPAFSAITIASGIITTTSMTLTLTSETGTSDTLDTINMSPTGVQMLLLRAASGHTITISHNVGNIKFASGTSFSLQGDKRLLLFRDQDIMYDTATSSSAGGASVSSVALTAPAIFSVAGSPITTSGTLALSLATQVKNKIFVGPSTGSDAAPTFRLMVLADLPVIATSRLLGRSTAASGAPEELTIGTGLQLVSGALSVTGGAAAGGEGESGNLVTNGGFKIWERGIAAAPDNWVLTGTGATIAREATIVGMGDYSAKVTRVGNDCHLSFDAYVNGGKTYVRGRSYVFSALVYATAASRARLRINDGTTTTYSSYHTGGSTWEFLTVTVAVGSSATVFNVGLAVDTGNTAAYIDGATLTQGSTLTYPIAPANEINRLPREAQVFGHQLRQPSGTAGLSIVINASQFLNGWVTQTTPATGDSFSFNKSLEAGTYTLSILTVSGPAAGKITYSIDGVDQASLTNLDYYAAGANFNINTSGSITIIGSGNHVFKGTITGKNASSSNYNWYVTMITIAPSSD